ncbi:Glycerol-3-phosphate ABC transporter, ATP-binding protein UgpC [Caenispirillum salinarum AK4]|uniref:Glycerol-3-phosphate ABC transporter, ATP-binding protein UgpC n=1 Tax=Caenispirillum salinarum AK4 TaxID=1238182 RepID=K9H584_9PROT|nr:sn-glycerol-3-phosphate import ATP-binding protein UgpC [Caenispirillum salinarum]EKV32712.1 Glycerol-3-phosphate ABC transporter, ATP-binding protein UgpC [Caenispirillum salinarum AK4]
MATVAFQRVEKTYPNGYKAIHGIDLAIKDGEFIVLVGPSGCGKSTLLRMVAGLEEVSSGEISIGDRVVNRLEPAKRDIAMVFQNYALYPHMSVYDNMAYGLRNQRRPKDEIDRRVQDAARILELGPMLERRPRQLSGGQRQRVAMGRAIVREPSVFLFDEPLSNLDAKLRVQMRLEIRRLQKDLGTTSIYVTHDQVEAMTMADRLVVMNGGHAEQVGAPLEVYAQPASVFVAGFIGSPAMNLIPAVVAADGASVALGESGDGPAIPLPMPLPAHANRPVTFGIRPEHLHPEDVGNGGTPLSMLAELVEPLGADIILHGRIENTALPVSMRLRGTRTVTEGGTVTAVVDHDHLHLFDRETGRRLEGI